MHAAAVGRCDPAQAWDVRLPSESGWRRAVLGDCTIWSKGDPGKAALERLASEIAAPETDEISLGEAIRGVEGRFAVAVAHPKRFVCAVDRIRSTPLTWTHGPGGRLTVAQHGADMLAAMGECAASIDHDQALAIALSGFTIGAATLYREVSALLPGRFLLAERYGAKPTVHTYAGFTPWRASGGAPESEVRSRKQLRDLTLAILEETVRNAAGRPIAVPLSAGLDSRLIVSGLHHLGHRDVLCFAYGRAGNREAVASKAIAGRLGYPWRFAPYRNGPMRRMFRSRRYKEFAAYADSLTSVHFPQDFPALVNLLEDGYLPRDAVVVNGQSGDFISGNHIPPALQSGQPPEVDPVEPVVAALLSKHFTQWRHLRSRANLSTVAGLLRTELDDLLSGAGEATARPTAFGLYEASEFVDRQCKYVVNGQRAYEFLGLGWDLPLWHNCYLDFWQAQPLSNKRRQTLYRNMLFEADWGGVWRDIPVNRLTIRPLWLAPIRLILKAMHAPLGRDRWHDFERRYLDYFMTPLCGYAARRWVEIAGDRRRPRTALCPHIEDYLEAHGVRLGSLSTEAVSS